MKLPESFTRVTPLSKILAAILFIILPFLGFYLGMGYQKAIYINLPETSVPLPVDRKTPTPDSTTNWKTYTNSKYEIEFKYPQLYSLNEYPDKIEIYSPLSTCNPKLLFNIEEYGEMYEVKIIVKQRLGRLEDILSKEGGKDYGWKETIFSGNPGYSIEIGAEMITPMERYLVEEEPNKVLDIQTYIFGSDDMGKCSPKLDSGNAMQVKTQILSTFKFIDENDKYLFDACKAKVGDQINNMKIISIEQSDQTRKVSCINGNFIGIIRFEGEVIVEGVFEPILNSPEEGIDFGGFYVDKNSINQLPKDVNDDRGVWFRLKDNLATDQLREQYGTKKIKIMIRDYKITEIPVMGPANEAELIKVID